MMPARLKLVVCETTAAIVLHLRKMGDTKVNYNGNAHGSNTLCGLPVGWDTKDDLTASNCRNCLTIMTNRSNGIGGKGK